MDEKVAILGIMNGLILMVCWVTWVIATNFRKTKFMRIRAEMQNKLLDRFGGSQELLAYLQTDAGKQFLDVSAGPSPANPYSRILASLQFGVIAALVGIALLFLRTATIDEDIRMGLLVNGVLVATIGTGFVATGALSYNLSKRWGLFDRYSGTK